MHVHEVHKRTQACCVTVAPAEVLAPMSQLDAGQGGREVGSAHARSRFGPSRAARTDTFRVTRKRSGQTFSDTNSASVALSVCDGIFGVAEAFNRAGPVLNVNTGLRGLESLGGSFRAASVPKVFLGPGRHDGLELGFDMVWNTGCTCIKYRDNGHRIPAA